MTGAPRPRRRRDEAGAVVPIVAAMIALLIVIASFAVDLGMLRVTRRDMQSLADVVALDLSRLVDGRTADKIIAGSGTGALARPSLADATTRSVARNKVSTIGSSPAVTATLVFTNSDGSIRRDAGGTIVPVPSSGVPQAVVVTARSKLDFAFSPGSGTVQRDASGANQAAACFTLGSYVAAVRSDAGLLPLLNRLTGLNLSATAVGYPGLLDTKLSIRQLANTTTFGTPEDVLTSSVTFRRLVQASIEVLTRNPDNDAAGQVSSTLTLLNGLLTSSSNLATSFVLGDALGISTTNGAALSTQLSLFDILTAGAALADGNSAVSLPVTATTGLSVVSQNLEVVEGRKLACGLVAPAPPPTACPAVGSGDQTACATSSQVKGSVRADLTPIRLPVAGITSVDVTGSTAIDVALGHALGLLGTSDPTCATGTTADPDKLAVAVSSALGTLRSSTALHVKAVVNLPLGVLGALVTTTVEFDLPATAATSSTPSGTAALSVPPNDTTPVRTGSVDRLGAPVLGAPVNLTVNGVAAVGLLGTTTTLVNALVVDPVVGAVATGVVNAVVAPFVKAVDDQVIDRARRLLGLDVAGVDVYATGRPTCQSPKLIG